MKFLGKMSLMIILKVKKPGLHLLSEKCLFGKTTGEGVKLTPSLFRVKKTTCFKSQDGTLIDLIMTNRPRSFLKSQNFQIGLSDCHKPVVSIIRAS